jgi:hypothetical protein
MVSNLGTIQKIMLIEVLLFSKWQIEVSDMLMVQYTTLKQDRLLIKLEIL